MKPRRIAGLVAIPVVAATLTACGSSSNDIVSIGIVEPKSLTPTSVNEAPGGQVTDALFAGLVKVDLASNEVVNNVAESVTTTDNKTWTVTLKTGYTFHNGEKVTADSYIDAWNYGAYGPNGQDGNNFFSRIEGYGALNLANSDTVAAPKTLSGLKKVDDLTFTIALSQPFADWKSLMSYNVFYPMPKVAFTNMKAYNEAPIGNGPFKIKGSWQHDKGINVEAYDKYPGVKPRVSGIAFRIYQQPSSQYSDLISDNVDVMTVIPAESLGSAKADLGGRYKTSPGSGITFLGLPSYNRAFTNPDVRKAISMAIDRVEIARVLFKGAFTAADSFVSPVVPGYRPGGGGEAVTFNPIKAKQLLDAAGGFPGGTLTITYNADGGHKEWVDAACNQIAKNLDITCLVSAEPKLADLRVKAKNKQPIGALRMGWSMDYASMENYLNPVYSTHGSWNYYGYANPAFDALVDAGNREQTTDGAIAKYRQAEDILARDVPVIPLFFRQNIYGYSNKVADVFLDARGRVDLLKIRACLVKGSGGASLDGKL